MAVEIEKTGKTIDDAKRAALEELQVAENMGGYCTNTALHLLRQIADGQKPCPHTVIKIMTEIGNSIRPVHNPSFHSIGKHRPTVMKDSILHLLSQIQALTIFLQIF